MPDFLVRGVPEHVMKRLKEMAAARGRSVNAEIREILERGTRMTRAEMLAASRESVARTAGLDLPDAAELIREDRER